MVGDGSMMHRMTRRVTSLVAVAFCLAGASCSPKSDHGVAVETKDNGYILHFRAAQLRDRCFAPSTLQFNPSLVLDGFAHRNTWAVVRAKSGAVDGLAAMLRADRRRIDTGDFSLVVDRGSLTQPSYNLQFAAFPCTASTRSADLRGGIDIVSVTADLAPYRYERPR